MNPPSPVARLHPMAVFFAVLLRRPLVAILFALAFTSCSPDPTVPESGYHAALVGGWSGTVGEMRETITFRKDGSFSSQVHSTGFISNTLGQGVTGKIGGTWQLNGRVIKLSITSAENDTVLNKTTTSTIEKFRKDELTVKSASGETSTFIRASN
jgi:hypothetical protein